MSDDEDPEVRADRELREASERDPARTRPTPNWLATETIAPNVAFWSCRNKACNAPVGISQEGIDAFEVSNRELRRRGEQPIRTDEVLICPACTKLRIDRISQRNRERADQMREAIRKLKSSTRPRQEHALIQEITRLRHPDMYGLLEALDPQNGKGKKGKL